MIDPVLDWLDRALFAFVRRVFGRTVAIVSLALYPGFGPQPPSTGALGG